MPAPSTFPGYASGTAGVGGDSPFTDYLRRQKIGLPGGAPFGSAAAQFQRAQWEPLSETYNWLGRLNAITDAQGGDWTRTTFPSREQWMAPLSGREGLAARREQQTSALSKFFGLTREQRGPGMSFEPAWDPTEGRYVEGGGNMSQLQDLVRRGTRQGFGGAGSRFLAGRVPQMLAEYQMADPGRRGGSFIDYLQARLGLGDIGVGGARETIPITASAGVPWGI